MAALAVAAVLFLLSLLLLFLRFYVVLTQSVGTKNPSRDKSSWSLLLVAGSGGHTWELLRLLGPLSKHYYPRYYVVADSDTISPHKINAFEHSKGDSEGQFTICQIPRSREVRQSWSSSVISTLNSFCSALPLMFKIRPDLVLCNGPGTCVPLCVAALLLGIFGIKKIGIVYVESVCRVHSLSLTGRILYSVSDYFFVQWPSLRDKYPKSIYLGRIV